MTFYNRCCMPETWSFCHDGRDLDEILYDARATYHHSATISGYVSRKKEYEIFKYNGRFGSGFVVAYPSFKGTMYCDIAYFIIAEDK